MNSTEKALQVLASLEAWEKAIRKINKNIKELDPSDDFCQQLSLMPSSLEGEIVGLLDLVLGQEIASYYLYEAQGMKNGGSITQDGKTYPIKTISDVKNYIEQTTKG